MLWSSFDENGPQIELWGTSCVILIFFPSKNYRAYKIIMLIKQILSVWDKIDFDFLGEIVIWKLTDNEINIFDLIFEHCLPNNLIITSQKCIRNQRKIISSFSVFLKITEQRRSMFKIWRFYSLADWLVIIYTKGKWLSMARLK